MAAPKVSWKHLDNGKFVDFSAWNMNKINADDYSAKQTIFLWNNFGDNYNDEVEGVDKDAHPVISDMQDVQITTTSSDADSMDVVNDKWIQVKLLSIGKDEEGNDLEPETAFTAIGGDTTHTLTAEGMREGCISGGRNNGLLSDVNNYAKFEMQCHVPANAPAGPRTLATRIIYYYT